MKNIKLDKKLPTKMTFECRMEIEVGIQRAKEEPVPGGLNEGR